MKKGLLAVVLAVICTIGLSGCDRVETGYVGIKVNKLGEDKGIGDINKWNGQLPQYMTQGANTPFITVK